MNLHKPNERTASLDRATDSQMPDVCAPSMCLVPVSRKDLKRATLAPLNSSLLLSSFLRFSTFLFFFCDLCIGAGINRARVCSGACVHFDVLQVALICREDWHTVVSADKKRLEDGAMFR